MKCTSLVPILDKHDQHIADLSCGALYFGLPVYCDECQEIHDSRSEYELETSGERAQEEAFRGRDEQESADRDAFLYTRDADFYSENEPW